jgi:hypothetical protein
MFRVLQVGDTAPRLEADLLGVEQLVKVPGVEVVLAGEIALGGGEEPVAHIGGTGRVVAAGEDGHDAVVVGCGSFAGTG